MSSKLRDAAETRFAALTRREQSTMSEIEAERQQMREKTERLRALRLAASTTHTPAQHAAKLAKLRKA